MKARRVGPSRFVLGRVTTMTRGRSSHFGWGMAMTAASATAGCFKARFSRSMELIHSARRMIDEVFGTVDDAHVAGGVDGGDVAGAEPAVGA